MKVYKCDGETFYGKHKCWKETENDLPDNWLTIKGSIENGLPDRKVITSNETLHFCSRGCFLSYFFKNKPTYEDLSIYYNFFKAGIDKNIDKKEIDKRFIDYGNEYIRNFKECTEDLKILLDSK